MDPFRESRQRGLAARGRRVLLGLLVLSTALFAASMHSGVYAQSIVIDDFNSGALTVVLNSAPGTAANFVDGNAGTVLQTERNLRVSGSSVAGGNISATSGIGSYSFTRPAGSDGTMEIWWDGNNNSTTFMPTGLGGVNLTANGQNAFRFQVTSSSSAALSLAFYVWTDGGNLSRGELTLPAAGGTVDLPYSSFSVFGGAGASFTNVGALFLGTTSPSNQAWTAVIDDLRTVQSALIFSDGFATGTTVRWSSVAP